MLKLIKDLGRQYATSASKAKKIFGIYECPICLKPFEAATGNVKSGNTKQCKKCATIARNTTHGGTYTRLYNTWRNIKSRCYYKGNKDYNAYGAKGVTICDEWKNDFGKFKDWSMDNGYEESLTIDKDMLCEKNMISPKIYSPDTCQWITMTENAELKKRGKNGKQKQ